MEVGDKPSSFTGSKEWIGCYEASIVLDHLYGVSLTRTSVMLIHIVRNQVSSKIIHVPCGDEVVKKYDVLKQHFGSIGSPVIIGT